MKEEKKNPLALSGFICAMVGFITMGATSIVGLVLSIIGLVKSKKQKDKYKSYAIVGIITSIVQLIITALVIVFFILIINENSFLYDVFKEKEPTLVESHIEVEENTAYIEGKIKNDTGKDITYYNIYFETYDEEGNITGNCNAYIDKLPKDKVWKFSAYCDAKSKNISDFKKAEAPTF